MSGVVVVTTGHSCSRREVVNSALEVDQYPLPNPSDLFASLSGGKNSQK